MLRAAHTRPSRPARRVGRSRAAAPACLGTAEAAAPAPSPAAAAAPTVLSFFRRPGLAPAAAAALLARAQQVTPRLAAIETELARHAVRLLPPSFAPRAESARGGLTRNAVLQRRGERAAVRRRARGVALARRRRARTHDCPPPADAAGPGCCARRTSPSCSAARAPWRRPARRRWWRRAQPPALSLSPSPRVVPRLTVPPPPPPSRQGWPPAELPDGVVVQRGVHPAQLRPGGGHPRRAHPPLPPPPGARRGAAVAGRGGLVRVGRA